MTTLTIMATLPAALLLLLTLINNGSAEKSPVPRRLLYKNNSSGELQYCHLCTRDEYLKVSKFSNECCLQNRDSTYNLNGVDYRPWCRAGIGLVPSCPEPRQPAGGWVDCGKTGTRVYGECQVHCPKYHQPQTPSITCQEEDLKWSAEPTCLVSECPPLQASAPCNITCESDGPNEVGDKCNVTCPKGFHPNMSEVMCQTDGTWSTTPRCEEDMAPFTGGGLAGMENVPPFVVPLLVVLLVVGSLVACYVYRKRMHQRKYDVAVAEQAQGSDFSSRTSVDPTIGSVFSSSELPAVTATRSALRLSWSSITSLFRNLFHGEAGQRRRDDVEVASSHMNEDEEGEMIQMHLLGRGSEKALEDQEVLDGDSSGSSEGSPLLSSNFGSRDQKDEELGESCQQQQKEEKEEEKEEDEAAHGASKQVPVEVHSTSEGEQIPSSCSSEEMKAIADKLDPDFIPPVGFQMRSRPSTPSDRSKPTYQWNLQKLIGFKVIIKNGVCKMISKIIERDEELMVSRGLEVQISAKCRDHDEEVENFSVRLFNEGTGRGEVIKEATGNSFRFIACLSFTRETYILSAQTSRTRQKHMVRFTLFTREDRISAEDPDETTPKEVYGRPMRCSPSNLYTPLPQLERAAPLVSNSNNETFARKGDVPLASVSQDGKLPGRAGEVSARETAACSQPLSRLLEAELGWMTRLLNKLEPISSRQEADSICGLYLHLWPAKREHVDVVCWSKQGDRHCSPARVLLEELSQEGLTTGHLVRYFAHPAHPRLDLLQMLREKHPFQSCPACQKVLSH